MYEILEIRSMQEIRELFPNKIADERNWLFLATDGIHGSKNTIEDCEYILRGENPNETPLANGKTLITVLVIQPNRCDLKWGEIQINLEDLNYLRLLVRSTLKNINKNQERNI
jgi:hypothetical protein